MRVGAGAVDQIISCVTREHDAALLLAAALVCGLGAHTAAFLLERAFASASRGRLFRLLAAGGVFGAAVWALHFLAMLAYRPGLPIGYDLGLTGLSVAAGQAVVAVGDAVVPAALAQDLALTLHELGTNAVKYGALSRPGGRVMVEGGATVGPDGRELRLTWREAGGPPVAEPARPGYGTLLLSQAIAYGRGGEVALDWRREGLVCTIRVPLAVPEDATTARAA